MSAASFKAAVPEPYQILGLRLLPLSLGRYRLMSYFEVGFVEEGDAKFSMEDFILGLLICSMRVDEFLSWFGSKKFHSDVRKWSRKVCPLSIRSKLPFGIGKRFRLKHSFLIHEKVGLFKRYLDQGSKMPEFWDESSGEGSSGGHWSHSVEVVLRSEVGWTEEEINERPLTKALADWLKHLENHGQVRLMTPGEIEAGQANAKIYEAMLKGAMN